LAWIERWSTIPLVTPTAASGKCRTRKEIDWKLKNEKQTVKFEGRRPRHFRAWANLAVVFEVDKRE